MFQHILAEGRFEFKYDTSFKKKYKCPIGYSGHEPSVSPSIIAAMLGAEVIERHITLDRSMWGTDQSASLSPEGLKNLSDILSKIPEILGDGKKRSYLTKN